MKPILSLIYFIYAESKNRHMFRFVGKVLAYRLAWIGTVASAGFKINSKNVQLWSWFGSINHNFFPEKLFLRSLKASVACGLGANKSEHFKYLLYGTLLIRNFILITKTP
jgi:hypothetical protein